MDLIDRLKQHADRLINSDQEVDRASLSADLAEARMELRTLRAAYVALRSKQPCSICGEAIGDGGHNAQPVNSGRCCEHCNANVVIPARIEEFLT